MTDPGAYCRALADLAHRRGARRVTAAATGFRREGQRLTAVATTSGEIACDRAVICAGAWSGPLARAAGDSVPLVSERGYHVVIPDPGDRAGAGVDALRRQDGGGLHARGIRLAGQVELADLDAAPDWRRVDVLLSFARDMLPALAGRIGQASIDRWMGHRPSTPDGLPCVGPASQCADIISCFGARPYGVESGSGDGGHGGSDDRRSQPWHRPASVFASKVPVMTSTLIYLSRRDVEAVGVTPDEAREAVLQVFAEHAAGLNASLPKSSIEIGPGHGFQAMAAASESAGIATLKWVAMAPVAPGSTLPGINGLICASDYATGAPLAVLDGDVITLIRTAAMSAAAATRLAPADPRVMGFVGCGSQAHAHLAAFTALFPGLTTVLAMSRTRSSADTLAEAAARKGLASEVLNDADELLRRSDIVISTVPACSRGSLHSSMPASCPPLLSSRRSISAGAGCPIACRASIAS